MITSDKPGLESLWLVGIALSMKYVLDTYTYKLLRYSARVLTVGSGAPTQSADQKSSWPAMGTVGAVSASSSNTHDVPGHLCPFLDGLAIGCTFQRAVPSDAARVSRRVEYIGVLTKDACRSPEATSLLLRNK